ncbi:hypothetical protein [Castellaniella sp.]|uniref:hypothetical protein n=1 Tax=Castellaniella sp. TaxID=1955812 RepID=UPI003C78B2D9
MPDGWNVSAFKWSITSCKNGIWGEDPDGKDDIECVRVADFDRATLSVNTEVPTLRAINQKERAGRLLQSGDLLIEKSGGGENQPVGQVVLYQRSKSAVCSNFIARIKLAKGMDSAFWNYVHHAAYLARVNTRSIKQTSGIQNLDQQQYFDERAAFPSVKEQVAISSAIDHECSRLDALIAKKAHFTELLREKRRALITHAVTKGLDPNVPMKDSEQVWLGNIPFSWKCVASNRLFLESQERAHDNDEHLSATQKYGVIPLAEFERLEGRRVTHAVKNLEQRKHVDVDDFVISMRSFEGGIERVMASGCVRSSYVVLLRTKGTSVGFFAYLFKSSAYIQALQATATFIRDGQDLSYNNFRQVKIPCPPVDVQREITDFLDQATARLDSLVAKTERSIELLRERRSAFITAAVTGQIDLREEARTDATEAA